MIKPVNLSLKDWLVDLISKDLEMDSSICNTIISWAFLQAKEATKTDKIIEISGFGKIQVSPKKVERRIKKIKRAADGIRPNSAEKAAIMDNAANMYIKKYLINEAELERNTGGVEERPVAAEGNEGTHKEDTVGEAGDMQGV